MRVRASAGRLEEGGQQDVNDVTAPASGVQRSTFSTVTVARRAARHEVGARAQQSARSRKQC